MQRAKRAFAEGGLAVQGNICLYKTIQNIYVLILKAHTSNGFGATTVCLNHYLLSNKEYTTLVVLFGV